ncbi:uncharacterized protein PAC_13985 [Phialocephala subalpina]|uniref:Asteroid domain-containing protein n=1 Tax=Phialocephala subalpina TaxID=576137 RepID=A0A1L7XGF5_9HELO|nr:uncharacterized protein PAC_13985 [Phialocephala subalpina]
MGIRHLITFLEPYASVESLAGREVVIDGPAFAHHIFYLCLKATPDARNGFEAAPSYSVLVKTALAWLKGLQNSKAVIKKIYFDGFLPTTKFDTRIERLIDQTRRLTNFYKDKPVPCRATYPRIEDELDDVFCSTSIRSSLTGLPPLPFLVPAILEALGQSAEYGSITEVVPGEADLYCARYLKENRGLILTGDSDLLVHDLGPDGAVSFLRDIRPLSEASARELCCSHFYQPASIAKRLSLPDDHGMLSLAFEIVMDPFKKFPQLVKEAQTSKAITTNPKEFSDFIREYVPLSPLEQTLTESADVQSILRRLDPRISEFVLKFLARKHGPTELVITGDAPKLHIFLPFLLDCPIRTSAWESSTSVRQLAYGLMNLIISQEQTLSVFEHRKQSDKSDGRELQLQEISHIADECSALLTLLSDLRLKVPELNESQIWTALAIHQNIEWSNAHDKSSLITPFMQQFLRLEACGESGEFSWEAIQFFAELQASHYSSRVLKQTLSLVLAHGDVYPLQEPLQLLYDELQSLPDLTGFPSLSDASSAMRKMGNQEAMSAIRSIVDVLLPLPVVAAQTPSKAAKKKRKRASRASEPANTKKKPINNLFDLLDVE